MKEAQFYEHLKKDVIDKSLALINTIETVSHEDLHDIKKRADVITALSNMMISQVNYRDCVYDFRPAWLAKKIGDFKI